MVGTGGGSNTNHVYMTTDRSSFCCTEMSLPHPACREELPLAIDPSPGGRRTWDFAWQRVGEGRLRGCGPKEEALHHPLWAAQTLAQMKDSEQAPFAHCCASVSTLKTPSHSLCAVPGVSKGCRVGSQLDEGLPHPPELCNRLPAEDAQILQHGNHCRQTYGQMALGRHTWGRQRWGGEGPCFPLPPYPQCGAGTHLQVPSGL